MRTLLTILALLCGISHAAQPISHHEASVAQELAKNNGCFSCHSTSEKIVGPAYFSVAEKYKTDKDAAASLVQSIQYGSKGKWGRIPMPPHPSMSGDDLKLLARWVLSIEK
jgi:cytochrome c